MDDGGFWFALDLACACAHWEDENHQYKKSQETADNQGAAIGHELEQYRKQLNESRN